MVCDHTDHSELCMNRWTKNRNRVYIARNSLHSLRSIIIMIVLSSRVRVQWTLMGLSLKHYRYICRSSLEAPSARPNVVDIANESGKEKEQAPMIGQQMNRYFHALLRAVPISLIRIWNVYVPILWLKLNLLCFVSFSPSIQPNKVVGSNIRCSPTHHNYWTNFSAIKPDQRELKVIKCPSKRKSAISLSILGLSSHLHSSPAPSLSVVRGRP